MQLCPLGQGTVSHEALSHAVPVLQVLPKMSNILQVSKTLLEALATPWDSVGQCPMGHCPLSQGEKLHRLDSLLHATKHYIYIYIYIYTHTH